MNWKKILVTLSILFGTTANILAQVDTITVSINPSTAGSVIGAGEYPEGSDVTLEANTNTGYSFVNWTENGVEVSTDSSYSFTAISNRALEANFVTKSYTISTNSLPVLGGITLGDGVYDRDDDVDLIAIPNLGYSFVNWTENGTEVSTDSNYSFKAKSNRVLTANFLLDTYNISTSSLPLIGGITLGGGVYNHGDDVDLTAIPNVGYSFVNWTENGFEVSTDSVYSFNALQNRILVANFSLNSYSISGQAAPVEGGTVTGVGIYSHGDNVTLTAFSALGYTFVNWTENDLEVSTDSAYSFTAISNRTLIANFSLNSYLIEAVALPIEGGIITGSGSFNYGDNVNLIATPSVGYNFVNWTENGSEVSSDSIYSIIVNQNRSLTANFTLKSFAIVSQSLPLVGGTTTGDGNYLYGENATLTALSAKGYSFVNWTENSLEVSVDSAYTFVVDQNRNLVANFSLDNYQITTSSSPIMGGITSGGGFFDAGQTVQLAAVPADGYTFEYWSENGTLVTNDSIYSFLAYGNRNFVANFIIKKYQVTSTAVPSGGGSTTPDNIYDHGSLVKLTASPKNGWNFVNWSNNNNVLSIDTNYSFVIFKDENLFANFSKKIYPIDANIIPVEGGSVTGLGNYKHDSLVVLTAYPNFGWNFLHWKENDETISNDSVLTFIAEKARNFEAYFAKNTYPITTSVYPENSGISFGDSNYVHGETVAVVAIPDTESGYKFVKWTEDGNDISTDSVYSFVAQGKRSLVANFQLRSYNVNLDCTPSEGGSVNGFGRYIHGDNVTIEAIPDAGWLFANWTEKGVNVSSDTKFSFEINENKEFCANFAHELYTIITAAEPSDAGFISGSGSFYYGQTAVLTPNSHPGWEFENWTKDEQIISTDSILIFTVTENANIKANYKLRYYSINSSVNPAEAGITSGSGLYVYNQEMVLQATPNNGWEFINWTENGIEVSTSQEYEFDVNADRDLVANFDLITGIEMNNNEVLPENYYLSNAYPNPFNPSTKINFGLPESSNLTVQLFNINGQLLRSVLSGISLPAGNYRTSFSAENLASGIYLYVFIAKSEISGQYFKKIEKLILLK